mgnify:CR=1 FL=1
MTRDELPEEKRTLRSMDTCDGVPSSGIRIQRWQESRAEGTQVFRRIED